MRGRIVIAAALGSGVGWLCGPVLPYAAWFLEAAVFMPMTDGEMSPAFVLALLLPGAALVFGTLFLAIRSGDRGRQRSPVAGPGSGVSRAFGVGWVLGAVAGAGAFYFAVPP